MFSGTKYNKERKKRLNITREISDKKNYIQRKEVKVLTCQMDECHCLISCNQIF